MTVAVRRRGLTADDLPAGGVALPGGGGLATNAGLGRPAGGRLARGGSPGGRHGPRHAQGLDTPLQPRGPGRPAQPPPPGRKPRLTPEQSAELKGIVERGPDPARADPARDGVPRWRLAELRTLSSAKSTEVVEIRGARRRAGATATSLAQARRRLAGEVVIGPLG